jgi:nucleotide-binding universal stress UspA family protein
MLPVPPRGCHAPRPRATGKDSGLRSRARTPGPADPADRGQRDVSRALRRVSAGVSPGAHPGSTGSGSCARWSPPIALRVDRGVRVSTPRTTHDRNTTTVGSVNWSTSFVLGVGPIPPSGFRRAWVRLHCFSGGGDAPHARYPRGTAAPQRADLSTPRRPILVGIHESPASGRALAWAIVRAQAGRQPLGVVHAFQWHATFDPYGVAHWSPDVPLEVGRHLLDDAAVHARTVAPHLSVFTRLCAGDPTEILAQEAHGAELVVVGRSEHCRWFGVPKWTVGARVARRAPGRVVIVGASNEMLV